MVRRVAGHDDVGLQSDSPPRNHSGTEPSRYLTKGLGRLESTGSLHRVSGPLVSAVVTTLATGPASAAEVAVCHGGGRAASIPLWLMIVLLSPLDAYAAAKNLSRGYDDCIDRSGCAGQDQS
jgi:hypothetical protein